MTCVCVCVACLCVRTRVHVRAAACRHVCTWMWIRHVLCRLSCACVVCCAETSQSDACMHTAAAFCILVHPVTHTHAPSLFAMGCHKRTWQSLRAWGMLAWEQNNPRLLLQKGSGRTAGGAAWTTHARGGLRTKEDRDAHLLALRPLLASSIDSSLPHPPVRNRFWSERLAQRLRLEAYPLPARLDRCPLDCVRGGKATLGVRVCGGGANERIQERAERQASTNQTLSAAGTGSVYRPQDPPT
jgi:hypothetical protein